MSTSSRSASARSSSSGPSNTGVVTASGRGPAIGCSIRPVSLAEIHLVEPLDPGRRVPAPPQRGRVPRLARVREPRLDLLLDDVADVDLQVRLQPSEAPRLGGLVRR